MASHSSILASEISWTEELDGVTRHGVVKSWTWLSKCSCTHNHGGSWDIALTRPLSDWDFWEPIPRITVNLALGLMQSLNTFSTSLIFRAPTGYGSWSIWVQTPLRMLLKTGEFLAKQKFKYLHRYLKELHLILVFFFKSQVNNTQLEVERRMFSKSNKRIRLILCQKLYAHTHIYIHVYTQDSVRELCSHP